MAAHPSEPLIADPVVGVLVDAMEHTDALIRLEARRFELATEWAALHPGDDDVDRSVEWGMRPLQLAGDGAPSVDEAPVAELAFALGMSHDQGLDYVGDALETRHRLPRLWARVMAGEVPVWKARRVAGATMNLPMAAAGFVDRQLTPVLHDCSFAQIDRTVEAARAEHDPVEAERRRAAAAERRHLRVHLHHVDADGLVAVEGLLDLADAIAFDKTLATRAATLDPELPLDVRRSMAAGHLGGGSDDRQVVVYTHTRPDQAMVEVENTRSVVTPDQIREWCTQAGTRVTVRPVLDLNTEHTTTVHDPTPTLREQAWARFPTCVFPTCTRPSRGCDLDHRTPWPTGPTTSSNIYPLCRRHHRLKTTGGWHYRPLTQNTIEWTSPHGWTYLRHLHRHTN